jgi:uncharacterized protein with GYD domain
LGEGQQLVWGDGEDWEDDMTTFITQARFTKEGFNAMIAAPEDRAEIVGRLIAQVGGNLIAYYLTSGEFDILLIFEGPSYEETVPALIVAAAESGVADLKTVTASGSRNSRQCQSSNCHFKCRGKSCGGHTSGKSSALLLRSASVGNSVTTHYFSAFYQQRRCSK